MKPREPPAQKSVDAAAVKKLLKHYGDAITQIDAVDARMAHLRNLMQVLRSMNKSGPRQLTLCNKYRLTMDQALRIRGRDRLNRRVDV